MEFVELLAFVALKNPINSINPINPINAMNAMNALWTLREKTTFFPLTKWTVTQWNGVGKKLFGEEEGVFRMGFEEFVADGAG